MLHKIASLLLSLLITKVYGGGCDQGQLSKQEEGPGMILTVCQVPRTRCSCLQAAVTVALQWLLSDFPCPVSSSHPSEASACSGLLSASSRIPPPSIFSEPVVESPWRRTTCFGSKPLTLQVPSAAGESGTWAPWGPEARARARRRLALAPPLHASTRARGCGAAAAWAGRAEGAEPPEPRLEAEAEAAAEARGG